jgi:hypothetical protein
MRAMRIVTALVSALALSACSASVDSESNGQSVVAVSQAAALSSDATKPLSDYYSWRRDLRRCASPTCGGYFVSLVNRRTSTCADGSEAAECYVAELTLPPGVTLEDADLVHGALKLQSYPALSAAFGVINVDAALHPVLAQSARRSQYALAYDTGIRCITTPCPSLALALLNDGGLGSNTDVTFVASDSKQRAALEDAFYAELGNPSSIGVGAVSLGGRRVVFDRSTRKWHGQFGISNVYVTKPGESPVCLVATEADRATAWNFPSADSARELAGALTGQVDVLDGRCGELLLPCTREYAPVYGKIDAFGEACVEHGNACEFRAAVIVAAGTDSKAGGSWQSGLCHPAAPLTAARVPS